MLWDVISNVNSINGRFLRNIYDAHDFVLSVCGASLHTIIIGAQMYDESTERRFMADDFLRA